MSYADGIKKLGKYTPADSARDRKFPYVRSPLYGELPAPKNLGMLFQYLEDVHWARPGLECWRGQANIGWRLDSTAARRLIQHPVDIEDIIYEGSFEKRVRNYEDLLLNQARMAGHGFCGSRELSDLELLSVLRHYGAATRLMDFTRNVIVALWFASSNVQHEEEYGLLVGLEIGTGRHLDREEDLARSVNDLMDEKKVEIRPDGTERDVPNYWYWEPRHLFERMRVQQSMFVFGNAIEEDPRGTAPFLLERGKGYREAGDSASYIDGNLTLIAVPPSLKESMIVDGRDLFGYNARALFPDIEGFSQYHGDQQRPELKFFLPLPEDWF